MSIDMKIVESILEKDKMYHHCIANGVIYLDADKTIKAIDLFKLTGKKSIPKEFNDYQISSGICPRYFTDCSHGAEFRSKYI